MERIKDENIIMSVNTRNLSKQECEEKIRRIVCKVLNKYLSTKQINIIQFSNIVQRATAKLLKHYELDAQEIKILTLRYVINALTAQLNQVKNNQYYTI